MPSTLKQAPPATPRERLPESSGGQIKAQPRAQVPATRLRDVAADTIHGTTSQKAAAVDIGISEGRLSHKLQDGSLTLAQLEELGPSYAVAFAKDVLEQIAPLATPQARAKQTIKDIRKRLDELEQAVELIA